MVRVLRHFGHADSGCMMHKGIIPWEVGPQRGEIFCGRYNRYGSGWLPAKPPNSAQWHIRHSGRFLWSQTHPYHKERGPSVWKFFVPGSL